MLSFPDLSSNVRNQAFMLNSGLFDPLLHETKLSLDPKSKSDHECTRYCLLALANLAVNPVNQKMIIKSGLQTLSDFSKHRDVKCRQHAVFCLGESIPLSFSSHSRINSIDSTS